eukprot:TRINITY_DN113251_c0_g1_i1.p1 TRINITY_DN113251_c0_g1~~TRINITY_DN113251_c0_g1_i1.p1  ORF type:complete len:315 (-),score=100.53 TRINITY_DN113251_c0_g1_i1:180-1124(-)
MSADVFFVSVWRWFLLLVVASGTRLREEEASKDNAARIRNTRLETPAGRDCSKYEPVDEDGCKSAGCLWTPDGELGGLCKDQGDTPAEAGQDGDLTGTAVGSSADAAAAVADAEATSLPGAAVAKPASNMPDTKEIDTIADAARSVSDREGLRDAQQATANALARAQDAEAQAAKAHKARNEALQKLQQLNSAFKELDKKAKEAKADAAKAAAHEAAIKVKVFKAAATQSAQKIKVAQKDEQDLRAAAQRAAKDARKEPAAEKKTAKNIAEAAADPSTDRPSPAAPKNKVRSKSALLEGNSEVDLVVNVSQPTM